MKKPSQPYAVPRSIEADLARVRDYWKGLKRGQNDIPFADDLDVASLPGQADKLLVIDVFEKPERFRFAVVGREVGVHYGQEIADKFADEVEPRNPLEYLRAQCSATIERGAPTYYRHPAPDGSAHSYARMLFPLWEAGHISALLCVLAWS